MEKTNMKTFINGILYFFGFADNPIKTGEKDDFQSIKEDWINVGNDIRKAMKLYGTRR